MNNIYTLKSKFLTFFLFLLFCNTFLIANHINYNTGLSNSENHPLSTYFDTCNVDTYISFKNELKTLNGSPLGCGDCNGNIHELDGAINKSTSGCCSNVTVSSGCALEYAWMKCDANGNGCQFVTSWASWSGSSNYCPSSEGYYAFCVRYPGCNDIAGETGASYLCGGGGGGCNVTAYLSPSSISVCQGGTGTLNASASGSSGYSYSWSQGLGSGSSKTFTANGSTVVSVTVTDYQGCTSVASASVNVTARPNAPTSTTSAQRCGPGTVTVTATGCPNGSSYEWWNSADTQVLGYSSSFTTSVSSTTVYVAWCKNGGCYSTSGTQATAVVNPLPSVSAGNDAQICKSQSIVITANASNGTSPYIYNWNNSLGSGSSKTVAPTISTNYIVTVTDNKSCTASDAVLVTVNTPPTVIVNVDKSELCTGETAIFSSTVTGGTGTTEYQWQWSADGISFSDQLNALNATFSDNSSAVVRWFRVVVTKGGCSVTSSPVKRTIIPTPTADFPAASICTGNSTTLSLTNYTPTSGCFDMTGFENNIDTRGSLASSNVSLVTFSPISYSSVDNGSNYFDLNYIATGTAYVDYNLNITAQNLQNYQTLNVRIGTSGGVKFEAFIGDVSQGYTSLGLSATGNPGVHSFTLPTNTTLKDQVNQIKIRIQTSNLGSVGTTTRMNLGDIGFCGSSVTWSPGGETTSSITVSPNVTTSYTATVKYGDCQQVITKTVTVTPFSSSASNDGPLTCSKSSVTLTSSIATGVTYSWSGGGTSQTKVVNSTGTYTVTVTSISNGCTSVATTTVTGNNGPPVANAGADVTTTCTTPSAVLTATGGGTYLWSTGATTAGITVNPGTTTNYTVTVTAVNGCTASDIVVVTTNKTAPSSSVSNDGPLTCTKTSVLMTAGPATGVTYLWSNGGQTTSTKSVTSIGTYTVTVTNISNGCTSSATTVVTQNITAPAATADNVGGPLTCIDNSVTIQAFPNTVTYSFSWSGPAGYTATSRTNIVSTPGTYVVTVTDTVNGCKSTASTVVVQNISTPTASATNNGPLTCTKTSVNLTAQPGSGVTYLWSGGGASQIKAVTSPGTYTVTVTDAVTGCTSTTTTIVTQSTGTPSPAAVNDGPLTCTKTSVTLSATPTSGVTYLWSGGGTSPTKTVTAAGTYTVTVTNTSNGCSSSTVTNVIQNITIPVVTADNVGGPLTCIDNSVTIRALPIDANYTYSWSGPNGYTSAASSNNVSVSGTYAVTVTSTINGCSSNKSTTVLQDVGIPTVSAGPDKTVCNGTSTTLVATGSGTYKWSTNATTATISVNPSSTATYTVTVTGANGCTASDNAVVFVNNLPASGLAGPSEVCMDEYSIFSANPSISGATYAWTLDSGVTLDGDANDPTETIKWPATLKNTTRTVTLTVTVNNCTSTYSKDVYIKAGAYLNTDASYGVCQGGSVQIGPNPNDPVQVTPGASFQWVPSDFLNSSTVGQPLSTPPFDMIYTLTTTVNGCAVSKQIIVDVNVNLNPVADAGPDKNICIGSSVQIGGSPTATPPAGKTISGVLWTPSNSILTNPTVSPTTTQEYRVIVYASNGCKDTDFVNVVVDPKGKIGDFVWTDSNGNGCQDSGELGINGITVTLYNSNGTQALTTTTINNPISGAAGYYQFDVCPGNYYVNFQKPAGYTFTGTCADPDKNSDANSVTGNTQTVSLASGQVITTLDAGFIVYGNIRGNVTKDTNNDKTGDIPFANVTIQLKDAVTNAVLATTTTDASGNYAFLNQAPGNYIIMEVQPVGYKSVSDVDATPDPDGNDGTTPNDMIPVTLTAGENDNDNNFVEVQLGNIRGNVTKDTDNNNTGDTPFANVTIQLKDALTNAVLATTTTDASGNYVFLNQAPGNYIIMEVQPVGYQSVSDVDATPDPDGNDGATPNDMIPVTLTAGENDNDNNFVEKLNGKLGDFVWHDLNLNGYQDSNEPGLANVLVRLFNSSGVQIAFKVTDSKGFYEFTNLGPDTYTVKFDQPVGFLPTIKDKVGDDAKDSDADLNSGITGPIVLGPGQQNPTIDAGYYKLAKLGDYVWEDLNANGVQNDLEPAIPNVTVQLSGTDAFGNTVNKTTTTNSAGYYEFVDLVPGTYKVTFVSPGSLYKPSPVNGTVDTAKDSDANVLNGESQVITLLSGENNSTIDAGFYRCAHVGDYVWLDQGQLEGKQDIGDVGLNGILVELYSSANPSTPEQTMYTINNPRFPERKGYYDFEVCKVGSYFIKVHKTVNYDFVQPNQGLDDGIDSDVVDFINQNTLAFNVGYAVSITDIDAGLKFRPLPVDLKGFYGKWNKSTNANELSWITLNEINSDYFEIERSVNGSAFHSIGIVKSSGNSAIATDYNLSDFDINVNGLYTYKLKLIDLDGKYTYSSTVDIIIENGDLEGTVKIYPNPATSYFNLELGNLDGQKVSINLTDPNGKVIMNRILDEQVTDNALHKLVNIESLPKGVYFVVININGSITVKKLIKFD